MLLFFLGENVLLQNEMCTNGPPSVLVNKIFREETLKQENCSLGCFHAAAALFVMQMAGVLAARRRSVRDCRSHTWMTREED